MGTVPYFHIEKFGNVFIVLFPCAHCESIVKFTRKLTINLFNEFYADVPFMAVFIILVNWVFIFIIKIWYYSLNVVATDINNHYYVQNYGLMNDIKGY